jgi:hypothetical protein
MYVLKHEPENVYAFLLLNNVHAHPSTDLLRSKNGKIKCLFLPPNSSSLVGFEVLAGVVMKIAIFWDTAPCSPYMN